MSSQFKMCNFFLVSAFLLVKESVDIFFVHFRDHKYWNLSNKNLFQKTTEEVVANIQINKHY